MILPHIPWERYPRLPPKKNLEKEIPKQKLWNYRVRGWYLPGGPCEWELIAIDIQLNTAQGGSDCFGFFLPPGCLGPQERSEHFCCRATCRSETLMFRKTTWNNFFSKFGSFFWIFFSFFFLGGSFQKRRSVGKWLQQGHATLESAMLWPVGVLQNTPWYQLKRPDLRSTCCFPGFFLSNYPYCWWLKSCTSW